MSAVILKTNKTGSSPSYVSGVNGADGVTFTEDASMALVFVDAAAATTFASGKNVHGAVQVTITGILNKHGKTVV